MKAKIFLSLIVASMVTLFSCEKEVEVPVYDQLAVTSYSPADNANSVSVGTNINISFSREIDLKTVLATSIDMIGSTGKVAGTVTFDGKKLVTFTPTAPLLNNEEYSVTVKGIGAKDGSVMEKLTFGFTTSKLAFSAMPMTPQDRAIDVRTDSKIVVALSGKAKSATISGASIHLCSTAGVIECTAVYNGNTQITFTPNAELKNSLVYTVVVSGIESLDGTLMNELKYSFTVEAPAFRIIYCDPVHGANNVPLGNRIVNIKFNLPVDHSTIVMGQTVTVSGGAMTWFVNAPVALESTYLFPELMLLEPNTVYTVTMDGVKSVSGLALPRTTIVFSTGTMK